MPCYPCIHCNKCGMYNMSNDLVCAACGAVLLPGRSDCAECGTPIGATAVATDGADIEKDLCEGTDDPEQ